MTKRKTPALNPLDLLSKSPRQNVSISELARDSRKADNTDLHSSILSIEPTKCGNWKYHDRPESELGDLKGLANEFKDPTIGQQQPCIVRPTDNPSIEYEVIVGERRWRASLLAQVKLKVIVRQMSDEEASLIQIAENLNRQDLSEYAEGMSLSKLIKNKLLKQKDIAIKFNLSEKHVSRLLSFAQIPHEIWDAVGDMSKVSARTSSEIRAILKKNPAHKELIIKLAKNIASGKVGANSLLKAVEKQLTNNKIKKSKQQKEIILSSQGSRLFSWNITENKKIQLTILNKEEIDIEKIKEVIKLEITRQAEKERN